MTEKHNVPQFQNKSRYGKGRPVPKIGHPESMKRKNMKTFRAPGVK